MQSPVLATAVCLQESSCYIFGKMLFQLHCLLLAGEFVGRLLSYAFIIICFIIIVKKNEKPWTILAAQVLSLNVK